MKIALAKLRMQAGMRIELATSLKSPGTSFLIIMVTTHASPSINKNKVIRHLDHFLYFIEKINSLKTLSGGRLFILRLLIMT